MTDEETYIIILTNDFAFSFETVVHFDYATGLHLVWYDVLSSQENRRVYDVSMGCSSKNDQISE